jgi:hypothetical protein
MDEFIVFDEDNNQFLTKEEIASDSDYALRLSADGALELWYLDALADTYYGEGGEHTPCQGWVKVNAIFYDGIRKTDIEGNKIYADSSIVEFKLITERGFTGSFKYGHGFVKSKTLRGFFTWNDIDLRYEIDIQKGQMPYVCLNYDDINMEGFKVIGTLQEHKHLLEQK